MEPKGTQSYIHKKDSKEISVRAAKLRRPKTDLFHLLAIIPYKEFIGLVDEYLGSKQKHPPGS